MRGKIHHMGNIGSSHKGLFPFPRKGQYLDRGVALYFIEGVTYLSQYIWIDSIQCLGPIEFYDRYILSYYPILSRTVAMP